MSGGEEQRVPLGPLTLTTRRWGSGTPTLVLLHDGLGSIAQWRDLPARLAGATGCTVVAYDRAGHGRSTPPPHGPWPPDWLERESGVLADLLAHLRITSPVLVGHSDGGSIALLHAAAAGPEVAGVVALAPHSHVEPCCVAAIAAMRAGAERFVDALARFHQAPAAVFEAWSGAWTNPAFQAWDIRPVLARVTAPTLVLQGDRDGYATAAMVDDTVAAIGGAATGHVLPGLGHLMHHEAPDLVLERVTAFVAGIGAAGGRHTVEQRPAAATLPGAPAPSRAEGRRASSSPRPS